MLNSPVIVTVVVTAVMIAPVISPIHGSIAIINVWRRRDIWANVRWCVIVRRVIPWSDVSISAHRIGGNPHSESDDYACIGFRRSCETQHQRQP